MKTKRRSDTLSKVQAPRRKRSGMSAPRHRSTWEPTPLQVPVPDLPDRSRDSSLDRSESSQNSGRGVLIIQYGDDE
jgi:hypothetical protein